jgi:hypothetical protein
MRGLQMGLGAAQTALGLLWRFTYVILPVPLVASCLALVVAGRAPARLRRRPAHGSLGLPVGAPTPRWMGARVGVHAVAVVVVGLVCWTLLSYLAFFALANLGFPFRLAFWINESASGAARALGDGAHRNSPLVLTEIPQVSQPVACPIQPRLVGATPFRSPSTRARWARIR